MMKKITFFIALILIASLSKGAEPEYSVSAIPVNLLKNANVVKRIDQVEFKIISPTSTVYSRHYAFTILNEKGEGYSQFDMVYDKLRKITLLEGSLYDAAGKKLKKIKNKDFSDVSAVDAISLIDDSRIKAHNFYYNSYPYTIEYSYETSFSHSFYFPAWLPIPDENIALQNASFQVDFPQDYELRYRVLNMMKDPVKQVVNGRSILKWNLNNQHAIKVPDLFATWKDLIPGVYLAPSDFQLDNIKGDMRSWKDYGVFQYKLIEGRDLLPENMKAKVSELVANAKDEKEKIKILYNYLQQNTRYISIQLGVGGWQPFDANYVAKNGYGDCKALVNYMHSLLKQAGIPSYYSLVYGGDNIFAQNKVMNDFPSTQFNHVILCIPTGKDSMWLECTDQELPAGYMSGFTSNRKALLIREDGGFLISTPQYGLQQNQQTRMITANVNDDGDAEVIVHTSYKGMQQDRYSAMIKALSAEKIKEYLSRSFSLASYSIKDYKYDSKPSEMPILDESLDIAVSSYATMMGKRIFIVPNIINKYSMQLVTDDSRTNDFIFRTAYRDSDHVEIKIPKGYQIESAIKNVELKTAFGKYSIKSSFEGDKIVYERTFEQYKTNIPATKQKEVVDFYSLVYKTDRSKMVLVKEKE